MLPIFITAFLIATDAFFIGVSLGIQKDFKTKYLFLINAIILVLCFIVFFIVCLLKDFFEFDTSLIVGLIFIMMGLLTVLTKQNSEKDVLGFKKVIVLSFVMSIDAMMGTAALAIEQSATVFIPLLIGLTHLLYTASGSSLSRFIRIPYKIRSIFSGLCLIAVGLLNILF